MTGCFHERAMREIFCVPCRSTTEILSFSVKMSSLSRTHLRFPLDRSVKTFSLRHRKRLLTRGALDELSSAALSHRPLRRGRTMQGGELGRPKFEMKAVDFPPHAYQRWLACIGRNSPLAYFAECFSSEACNLQKSAWPVSPRSTIRWNTQELLRLSLSYVASPLVTGG